jgi:HAD superfamily hydrolase (TIGR01509 family)
MKIRAVLWDIDGTLLESEPMHWEALMVVANHLGAELGPDDHFGFLGLSMPAVHAKIAARWPLGMDVDAFTQAVTDHYVANVHRVPPRAGAVATIDRLAALGIRQACVSNAGRPVVAANLRRLAHPALLFGLSRDDVARGKPHPDPYLAGAARIGVAASDCLVVEDSPVGAAAGVAAGMRVIAWPEWAELTFDDVFARVERIEDLDWDAALGAVG